MELFTSILVIHGFAYSLLVAVIVIALSRVHMASETGQPPVSVIVAARNEAAGIGPCLDSLQCQNYRPESYEVIVVDDRSTDDTPAILRRCQENWANLSILTIGRTPEGISPKKHALASAIGQAKGEIILQTDADCTVPPGWIAGMVSRFEPGVGLVAGVAPYRRAPGILNSFVRHEYLWNAALSAASIALGHGTHASGRNLAFRRDVFDRMGGYGESAGVASGDDTLLLHRLQRTGIARAVTMPGLSTHVHTDAPVDFAALLKQRLRHMSTGRYFEPFQIMAGIIVYGFHVVLILALALSFFFLAALVLFLTLFIWKTAADAIVSRAVRRILGLEVEWGAFIRNEFFLLWYMALMPCAGFLVPVKWK